MRRFTAGHPAHYEMIVNNELCTAEKEGPYEQVDVVPAYMEKILSDVKLSRPIKAVVDAGNGIAGPLAVDLLTRLGVEVQGLFTMLTDISRTIIPILPNLKIWKI